MPDGTSPTGTDPIARLEHMLAERRGQGGASLADLEDAIDTARRLREQRDHEAEQADHWRDRYRQEAEAARKDAAAAQHRINTLMEQRDDALAATEPGETVTEWGVHYSSVDPALGGSAVGVMADRARAEREVLRTRSYGRTANLVTRTAVYGEWQAAENGGEQQ